MRLLVLGAAVALAAAACGSGDDTTTAPADDPTTTATEQPADDGDGETDGEGEGGEPAGSDSSDYRPTVDMVDITDPRPHPIDDVVVSDDGSILSVRYHNATEPCSGAMAEAVEDDGAVTVTLQTGLNPDAATMSCAAEVVGYELTVALDAPLGDRELVITQPDGESASRPDDTTSSDGTSGDDTGRDNPTDDDSTGDETAGGAPTGPEAFIGLTTEEAAALAEHEGRPWRIGREDGEQFALTADYNPDRLTFEIDGGIVTLVALG